MTTVRTWNGSPETLPSGSDSRKSRGDWIGSRSFASRLALSLGMVFLAAGPGLAGESTFAVITKVGDTTSAFDWPTPFSLYRWLIFVLLSALGWFISFNVLMMSWLALDNSRPPRPKDAFARAAGWFVLALFLSFLFVFAVLCNDLYYKPWFNSFPNPIQWMNSHILWMAILVLGIGLMFLTRYIFRR